MTRVTKARVRQVILVNDEPIDPFQPLERMQFLLEDGSIVDPTKDNTKMGWLGPWDDETTYNVNSVVTHAGKMWIAPDSMLAGNEPGVDTTVDYLSPILGIQPKTYNKLDDGVPRTFTFPDDALVDTNGKLHIALGLDFIGAAANLMFHVVNNADEQLAFYIDGGPTGIGGPANVSSGATEDVFCNIGTFYGGTDHILSVYVEPDTEGSFTITATGADLAPPDLNTIQWEEMVISLTAPDVFPAGGDETDILAKASAADGDVEWVPASSVIPAAELPPGGATGYVLAKASGADGDVAWVAGGGATDGGYKGDWNALTTYHAGDIVRHSDGNFYATMSTVIGTSPSSAPANAGSPQLGIQARTSDQLDDGVMYTKQLAAAGLSSNNKKAIPLAIDFTSGSLANISLLVNNQSNETVSFYINGTGGAADSVFSIAAGASATKSIRFASFWGGSNPGIITLEFSTTGTTGYVEVTASGANMDPPDPTNPWVLIKSVPNSVVTTLPTTDLYDGMIVDYQNAAMATLGIVWRLRYRSGAGTNKWEFVGGGPLYMYDATQYNTSLTNYQDVGSTTLTVPRSGDYEIDFGAWLAIDNATSGNAIRAGVAINSVVDTGNEIEKSALEAPAYALNPKMTSGRVLALTAGHVIKAQFKTVGSGLSYIERSRIKIRPIRVI